MVSSVLSVGAPVVVYAAIPVESAEGASPSNTTPLPAASAAVTVD